MAYGGVIVPAFWDHEGLVACSVEARLIAVFLVTAREATLVPGLINLGLAGLAESAHVTPEIAARALAELKAIGFLEVDERRRLIRVPKAPLYNRAHNPNMLRGWYRRWGTLPNCPLRNRHVESLQCGFAPDSAPMKAEWQQTFGTHRFEASELAIETVVEQSPNGFETVSKQTGLGLRQEYLPGSSARARDPGATTPQLALVHSAPKWDREADLEACYQSWPAARRVGRAKGLAKLKSGPTAVKTEADAARFRAAMANYLAFTADGPDQYVMNWSRFCGEWREWEVARAPPKSRRDDVRLGTVQPRPHHEYRSGEDF